MYADAGSKPYSSKQVINKTYQLVFNTGVFAADCREWNKRALGRKTPPHIKVFFAATHREWRLSIQNETGAPYGTAHNTNVNPDDGCLQQDTVDTIANLETSTASNCAAIAELTATVARLTTELATVNVKLVVAFQTNRASRGGHGGRNRTTHGRGDGTGAGAVVSAPTMDEAKDLDPPIH